MIRVLSVDDHALLREGQEVIEKFRLHRPDVTLMDPQMPA
jgi:hypothetical protein